MTISEKFRNVQETATELFASPKGTVVVENHEFQIPPSGEGHPGTVPPALQRTDAEGKTHNLNDDEIMRQLLVESYAATVEAFIKQNGPLDETVMDGPSLGGWKVGHTPQAQSDENMKRFANYAARQ